MILGALNQRHLPHPIATRATQILDVLVLPPLLHFDATLGLLTRDAQRLRLSSSATLAPMTLDVQLPHPRQRPSRSVTQGLPTRDALNPRDQQL